MHSGSNWLYVLVFVFSLYTTCAKKLEKKSGTTNGNAAAMAPHFIFCSSAEINDNCLC